MSLVHVVSISDQVEVTDQVDREPNRIDILIQDVVAVADLVVLPRSLAIHSIEPGLIRGSQAGVVIKGQGFATSIAGNRVTFNGFVATITAAAEDELTVTTPFLLSFTENGFALVEVESPAVALEEMISYAACPHRRSFMAGFRYLDEIVKTERLSPRLLAPFVVFRLHPSSHPPPSVC